MVGEGAARNGQDELAGPRRHHQSQFQTQMETQGDEEEDEGGTFVFSPVRLTCQKRFCADAVGSLCLLRRRCIYPFPHCSTAPSLPLLSLSLHSPFFIPESSPPLLRIQLSHLSLQQGAQKAVHRRQRQGQSLCLERQKENHRGWVRDER
jgi:hypothetical protein